MRAKLAYTGAGTSVSAGNTKGIETMAARTEPETTASVAKPEEVIRTAVAAWPGAIDAVALKAGINKRRIQFWVRAAGGTAAGLWVAVAA